MEETVPTNTPPADTAAPITEEWVIAAASERHVAQGKTPDEARAIVLASLARLEKRTFNLPSFDEL